MDGTVTDANVSNSSIDSSLLSSPDFVPPVQEGKADGDDKDLAGKDGADGADKNADGKDAGADGKDGQDGIDKDKNLEDRFDQHPRFIELNNTVKTERAGRIAAEAKLSLLEKSPVGEMGLPTDVVLPEGVKDLTKMSADELREFQEDDPAAYRDSLLAIATQSIKSNLTNENVRNATISAIQNTFDEYAKQNPDFDDLWEKGEIPKYMKDHPGHNAISAHMALTGEKSVQAKIDAAVTKAVKETEERVIKNFQAKRDATVISSSGTRVVSDKVDTELKDTQQSGGLESVLAKRLAERRANSA